MKENPRAAKVAEFKEKITGAKVAVIAEYKGLTVKELEGFRRALRDKGARMTIIKNTLAKRALAETDTPDDQDHVQGQVAFVLGYEDAVGGPKAIKDFARKHDQLVVKAGIFEGEWVGPEVIAELASLASKDELRARLLLLLQGAQRKFVSLLTAIPQEFVGTVEALAKNKEESGSESEQDGT